MAISPEAYLISSILRENDYPMAIAKGIKEEMFHAYQDEYKWLQKYFVKYRRTPTKVAFRKQFPDFPLKAVNDTEHFVDEVRKSHARATMIELMSEMTDSLKSDDIEKATDLLRKAGQTIAAATGVHSERNVIKDYNHILDEIQARKDRHDSGGMAGVPFGFPTFDEKTGGFQPGQLWVGGARLGEGKSWSLVRAAVAAIIAGYNVHYASLEMTQAEVTIRVHNLLSGQIGKTIFNSMQLQQGKDFDMSEYREFVRSIKSHVKGQLTVSDSPKMGAAEISAQIERYKPDLYLLDYLTLAKMGGDGGWQDIGNFTKDLKRATIEYGLPIVAAAQLNRSDGVGKAMPRPEALAQADAIGQDADGVFMLRKRSQTVVEYSVPKFRQGQSDWGFWAKMDLPKGQFKEISYNSAQDQIDKDQDKAASEREAQR